MASIDTSAISLTISLSTVIALVIITIRAATKFGALDTKVETMWAFQMRRAMSEVVEKGIGTMNSPMNFTEKALASLEPIRNALIEFWQRLPEKTNDLTALLYIEQEFGDRLLNLVCLPCNLTHGACLILALSIAKQDNNVIISPAGGAARINSPFHVPISEEILKGTK